MARRRRTAPAPRRSDGRAGQAAASRRWLGWLAGGVAVAAAALALWLVPGGTPTLDILRTPEQNVLLITIDTLRADALGCYGGHAATPTLDRLAADGTRFAFAHAHSVVTLPSHASMLTGLYPFQHGVRDNSGYRLPAGTPTLATMLDAEGFSNGAFVGAFPVAAEFGLGRGFRVYDDRFGETQGASEFVMVERPADAVVTSALSWLRVQPSRWFAWVHVYDPHAPNRPPEPFASRYAADLYAGEVAFTDHALGPLIDFVRGQTARPTLVIVAGDHGEALGDHGEMTHGLFAYEATLRVPLIVAQIRPGQPAAPPSGGGRVSPLGAQLVDLLPTVLDTLALPAPDVPGRSLLRLTASEADTRASYFEALSASLNRGWAPLSGVLVGREKFIDLPLPELYDLAEDPAEQINRIDRNAGRARELEARLAALGSTEAGERQTEDPAVAARLRALGYMAGSTLPTDRVYTADDDPKRLVDLDQAVHRAVQLFEHGRLAEAAEVYRGILARRPDMALAYQHLAFVEWDRGLTAEAIATLRAALARVGPNPEIEAKLGLYLAETGALDEAVPLLERAAELPGGSLDVPNSLGIAYARQGRAADALATFERILAIDPRNAMALQNMGSVHLAAGRLSDARQAFGRALEANPNWAAAYTGLGVVELQSGRQQAAIDAWTRAVALDPKDFDALFNLATELVNARRMDAARPYLERFVTTAPPAFYADDIARLRALLRTYR